MLSYLLLSIILKIGKYIPESFESKLIKFLKFILKNVVRYRKNTIESNLNNAFPLKDKDSLDMLLNDNYTALSRYFIESFLGMAKGKKYYESKVKFENLEIIEDDIAKSNPIIVLGTHYGNWELIIPMLARKLSIPVFGVYKPIKNKRIDTLIKSKRAEIGLIMIPMNDTLRIMKEYKNKSCIFVLINDQGPANMNNVKWVNFYNQQTPCMNGVQKLSTIFITSIYYLKTEIKRDLYINTLIYIKLNSKAEIIPKYMELLEQNINIEPSYWLWSHKRWKRAHLYK
jgi:KDO2-lipid IV(A) lauroyltransferase